MWHPPRESGIYFIINVLSGIRYVGKATNIANRLNAHYNQLLAGTHHCRRLQVDFSRCGIDHFDVRWELFPLPQLDEMEAWLMQLASVNHGVYNTTGRRVRL